MRYSTLLSAVLCVLLAGPANAESVLYKNAQQAVERKYYDAAMLLLHRHLALNPDDIEARFLYARVLAWNEHFRAALIEMDTLLATKPNDVDYLLTKSQALVWSGQPRTAIPVLDKARSIAPEYEALWHLELQALAAIANKRAQKRAKRLVAEAKQKFPSSQWVLPVVKPRVSPLVEPIDNSGNRKVKPTEIELGIGYDELDTQDNWQRLYGEFQHQFAPRKVLYGRLELTRRFNLNDNQIMLGRYHPLGEKWTGLIEATVSPSAKVLPEWTMLVQIQRALRLGWGAHLGIKYYQYTDNQAESVSATLERYWHKQHVSYTFYNNGAENLDHSQSHRIQYNYFYGYRNRIGASYAWGEENELLPGNTLLVSDIKSTSLVGRHWLTPDWAMSYSLTVHHQGNTYVKTGGQLGFRYRY